MKIFASLLGASGFMAVLVLGTADQINPASAQPLEGKPFVQEGVDVLTHGPVHEAFAQPVPQHQQQPSPIVPKRPPNPVTELPPEERPDGDQAQWIPGYWAWENDRNDFLWVSGIWRVPPPGREWVPGYWHEADAGWQWVSGYWLPASQTTVELYPPPPEPIQEAIPSPPDQDSTISPGCWVYREGHYWWRPQYWVRLQPGWLWTPDQYYWTPAGYVFVKGYWDQELYRRGLCFAPVIIDRQLARRPGWVYRPAYVIATDFLLGCLFVNTNRHHYYFGDYFDVGYARRGYVPWVDYHMRKNLPDPLWTYYHWHHFRAKNQRWDADLQSVYTSRQQNAALRPPRTLVQQERMPVNQRAVVVTPLKHWKGTAFKLEPVSKNHYQELQKHTEHWRTLSHERGKLEVQARPKPQPNKQPVVHAPVRVELPKRTIQPPPRVHTPPPAPVLPKAQQKAPHSPEKKGKGK